MQEPSDNPETWAGPSFQGLQQGGRVLGHESDAQRCPGSLGLSRAAVIEADTVEFLPVGFHLGDPAGAVQPGAHDEDQRRSCALAFIVDTDPRGEIEKGHGRERGFP